MDNNLQHLLNAEYEKWKISPHGAIVALTRPGSYTKSRIMVGVKLDSYSHTF